MLNVNSGCLPLRGHPLTPSCRVAVPSDANMLTVPRGSRVLSLVLSTVLLLLVLSRPAQASVGDRLPEFRDCMTVCEHENCGPDAQHRTPIPLTHRLLLWTCPQECDQTCQHVVTSMRVALSLPTVQFHGKWPFRRLLGIQEPFSVLCSLANLYAHYHGLTSRIYTLPATYPLRKWYVYLARIGLMSWLASTVFHTRDFYWTETADYLAAGASVMYGLYYTPVRVFRLDKKTPMRRSLLRIWSGTCAALYIVHVGYLLLVKWDYGYNMAANVVAGVMQNALWSWFSYRQWRDKKKMWTVWPGVVVAWVTMAMSLELLDFPPLWGIVDAHSLWHAGTVAPTILFYNFLVKDAQDDMAGTDRFKS